MNTDGFIVHCKNKWYLQRCCRPCCNKIGPSNFERGRPLGGQIMNKFVGLRAKKYSYLNDKNDKDKKVKAQKSVSS